MKLDVHYIKIVKVGLKLKNDLKHIDVNYLMLLKPCGLVRSEIRKPKLRDVVLKQLMKFFIIKKYIHVIAFLVFDNITYLTKAFSTTA